MQREVKIMNINELNPEKCTGCGACYNICPQKAITMQLNEEGFWSPHIDMSKCVDCGLCYNRCPAEHPVYNNGKHPECLAVAAEDDLRGQRSSGAVFPLLAEYVLENGGYVCGAAWNEDNLVEHIIISDKADLSKLKSSKYLQSNTKDVYSKIKLLLKENKLVLFSGTPCQVAGLNAFLGKAYNTLLTVDIVCHGTPSPKVYKKYLEELVPDKEEKVVSTNFRDKADGWSPYLITTKTTSSVYSFPAAQDTFMQAFLKNLCLNKSCAACPFAKLPRQGDITLGDFWGIDKYSKKLNDSKGTSLVLVNSPQGRKYMEYIKKRSKICKPVPIKYGIKGNPCLIKPSVAHKNRNSFMADIKNSSLRDSLNAALGEKYDCGILNFWFFSNYGAMLTCYALQETIKSLGKKPRVINYIPLKRQKDFKSSKAYSFASEYLSLTEQCSDKAELQKLNAQTDIFIAGSDQIWRYPYFWPIGKNIFQLNFADSRKKKIAYAASFGTDYFEGNEEETMQTKYYLQQFDNISVREEDGVDICRNTFGVSAEQVLDPVFLADTKLWENMAAASARREENFVASYVLDRSKAADNVTSRIKKHFSGTPCIDMTDGARGENADVKDWIRAIQKCRFFVTDSFHGACFAIIFNKPFVCLANKSRGESRFKTLFKTFGLESRCISETNMDISDILVQEIDYNQVNKIIEREAKRSKEWLLQAINSEKTVQDNVAADMIEHLNTEIDSLKRDIARITYPQLKKRYMLYRLLSAVCFGKKRRKYKEKRKKLKSELKKAQF